VIKYLSQKVVYIMLKSNRKVIKYINQKVVCNAIEEVIEIQLKNWIKSCLHWIEEVIESH
jgi:hypothetical protein